MDHRDLFANLHSEVSATEVRIRNWQTMLKTIMLQMQEDVDQLRTMILRMEANDLTGDESEQENKAIVSDALKVGQI